MLDLTPEAFVDLLRAKGIRRFHLETRDGGITASHDEPTPLARFLQSERRDFQGHEGLFFQVSAAGVLQGAFVHRTVRGQAAGGVRLWRYATVEEYLRDGLRLAVGMTRTNALAGLWWGGGKGVMDAGPALDAEARVALYREYGDLLTALRGCYVTAEDVGTRVDDMAQVFTRTRFTTCIPPALGGSGNPSIPTARGVVVGIEAALEFLGAGSLAGRTVAVRGLGNVSAALIGFLRARGATVIGADVSADAVARVRAAHPEVDARVATDDAILAAPCDVLAPCATGAGLNARTIPAIAARVVCGAANNQLEEPADDAHLAARGITYVPDFLVNRMGTVTCADEQAGYVPDDPLIERHLDRTSEHGIWQTTLRVLGEARATGRPPGEVATDQADALADEPHPLLGHRGRRIIDGLVPDGWWRR